MAPNKNRKTETGAKEGRTRARTKTRIRLRKIGHWICKEGYSTQKEDTIDNAKGKDVGYRYHNIAK